MTLILLFILAIWAAGGTASAQISVIRSGEHDGFTRLVLPLPKDVVWTIDNSDRQISVQVDSASLQFDFSRVFARIGRNRLAAISQEGAGSPLVFSLACACSVANFVDTPGFLVFDISDEAPVPDKKQPAFGRIINQLDFRLPIQISSSDRLKAPKIMLPNEMGQVLAPAPPVEMPPLATRTASRPPNVLNLSEQRLLAQISRASGQGLLEMTSEPSSDMEVVRGDGAGNQQAARNLQQQAAPRPVSLSATTAVDRELAQFAGEIDQLASGPTCLSQDQVGINNWGGEQSFAVEISHWRSLLFGEFDALNAAASLKLARTYLYYGFGAEAAQVIGLVSQGDEQNRVLKAISEILDTGESLDNNPFVGQQGCDGDVALWSVLASDIVEIGTNTDAVLRGFSRLPIHLRSYLGPKISQRFSKAGDGQTAGSILRAINRMGEDSGAEIKLANAAVATLQGDTQTVEQELTKSVEAGSEYSPQALVKLVANWFETREALSPELPDLTGAYAAEFRNAKIGADLRRTHVVALALTSQFGEAFALMPDLAERDGDTNKQKALSPLLELLAERADDVSFLRFALGSALQGPVNVPDQIQDRIASRLLELGFPEEAALWTNTPEGSTSSENRRLLRAEIALERQLPQRALVELVGLTGPKATNLRAAAAWKNGEYSQAGQMLTSVGNMDGAARAFWLGEDWEAVPGQTETQYSQIVADSVQLRAEPASQMPVTPLARARALMNASSGTRAEIAALLRQVSGNVPALE